MASGSSPSVCEPGAFKNIVFSLAQEVPGLTEAEKCQLEAAMKKAQELDAEAENTMRQPIEGQLYKYTNVMKGWQFRWFILTPETGMLEYYMLEERKKHRPRGALHLTGAAILPSEEDNQSFTVSALNGEVYKLKAADAKERQFWVDRIRTASESCSVQTTLKLLQCPKGDLPNSISFGTPVKSLFHLPQDAVSLEITNPIKANVLVSHKNRDNITDSLAEIKASVSSAVKCQKDLASSIEDLPYAEAVIKCSDRDLLLLKATSQAAVQSLEQCYLILRRRQREAFQSSGVPFAHTADLFDKCKSPTVKTNPKKPDFTVKNT